VHFLLGVLEDLVIRISPQEPDLGVKFRAELLDVLVTDGDGTAVVSLIVELLRFFQELQVLALERSGRIGSQTGCGAKEENDCDNEGIDLFHLPYSFRTCCSVERQEEISSSLVPTGTESAPSADRRMSNRG